MKMKEWMVCLAIAFYRLDDVLVLAASSDIDHESTTREKAWIILSMLVLVALLVTAALRSTGHCTTRRKKFDLVLLDHDNERKNAPGIQECHEEHDHHHDEDNGARGRRRRGGEDDDHHDDDGCHYIPMFVICSSTNSTAAHPRSLSSDHEHDDTRTSKTMAKWMIKGKKDFMNHSKKKKKGNNDHDDDGRNHEIKPIGISSKSQKGSDHGQVELGGVVLTIV